MDNFDCLTVVVSHVDDLETLLSLRSVRHNLCNYISKNLKIVALRMGITEDVIDIQNFIYQYARIRLTATPRILSEKRLLKLALIEDNIPVVEKYSSNLLHPKQIAWCFKLCRSLEALEVLISSYGEQLKTFYIPIPYIISIELPRLVEIVRQGTSNSTFDMRYYSESYIRDTKDRIDPETYVEIGYNECYSSCFTSELLPLVFSNSTPEETPSLHESEVLLEGAIRFSPDEDTTLLEYILGLGNFTARALHHAIRYDKYKIVLFLLDKISDLQRVIMSKFSYDVDIMVEVIGKLTKFSDRFVSDFCSLVMACYTPTNGDTRIYDKIREIIPRKVSISPTVKYHPLAKAYMIKYMDCSCSHFVNTYSKEKQRKFEYYLKNI